VIFSYRPSKIPKILTELAKHELSRQLTVSDLTQHHAIALRRSGEHFSVDIHGRPLRDVRAEELSNEFFRHAVLCEFDDHKTHRPCYEHMLLHTIVHGTEWALEPRYDWLADAVMILRAAESGFDWNFLSACAGRYRLGPIVGQALRKLAQTFAIAIPHAVLATLSRGDVVDQIEARQRAKGPVRHFSHRLVGTLQQVRRQDVGLAGRSVFASMPALWKKRYGSPALTQFADRVDGDESVFYLSGWHVPEDVDPPGRWTDGSSAVLAIRRASGRSGRLLRLSGFAIQTDRNHPQVIDLHAGWRRLARLRRHTQDREIDLIPLPSALHERELIILRLRIRRPLSPAAIGRSPDVRQLGFFLQDIRATSSIRDASSVPLKIHNNSSDIAILWSGWSRPEADGCWSDGAEASLLWTSPSDLPANARVIMSGQIFATDQPLTGSVFVNGHRVDRPLVMNSGPVNLSVPLSAIRGDREIHIGLRFDNPRSPRDLGISSDNRRLGLFLQTVFIEVNG